MAIQSNLPEVLKTSLHCSADSGNGMHQNRDIEIISLYSIYEIDITNKNYLSPSRPLE